MQATKRTARMSTGGARTTTSPVPIPRLVEEKDKENGGKRKATEAAAGERPAGKKQCDKTLVIKIVPGGMSVYYLVPTSEVTEEYKTATIVQHPVHLPLLQATESRWCDEALVMRRPFELPEVAVYCYHGSFVSS